MNPPHRLGTVKKSRVITTVRRQTVRSDAVLVTENSSPFSKPVTEQLVEHEVQKPKIQEVAKKAEEAEPSKVVPEKTTPNWLQKMMKFLAEAEDLSEVENFVTDKEHVLKAMFYAIDSNGTGSLSLEELKILDGNLYLDHSENLEEPLSLKIEEAFRSEDKKAWSYPEFFKIMEPYVRLNPKELSNPIKAEDKFRFSQNHEQKQKTKKLKKSEKKIVHSWTMWPAKFDQAYVSPILAGFLLCYQIIPVIFQIMLSEIMQSNRDSKTVVGISLVVMVVIMVPLVFAYVRSKKFRLSSQLAINHLQELGKFMLILAASSYLMSWITLCFGGLVFQQSVLGKFFEFLFPWLQNTFCLLGITIITLYNLSEQSQLAGSRDLLLLERDKFTIPTEKIKTARDLVMHMRNTCVTSSEVSHEVFMCIRNLIGPMIYCFLLLIVPEYENLKFMQIVQKRWMTETASLPEYSDQCYFILVLCGALTMFLSSYALDKAISRSTFAIFKKNANMMEMLLSTTLSIESAMNNLPFCVLYQPADLRAFLHVHAFLKKHEQDKGMAEASAGFAGILLVDVALILISLITIRIDWYNQLMPGFYAVFATSWCFVLIGLAVKINSTHEDTLSRLIDYQAEVSLLEGEGTEATALLQRSSKENIDGVKPNIERVYNMLSRVQSSVSQNFKPVTVLGIAATPTLSRLFFGYLVTAVIAYLVKNVLKLDFLPI